MRLAHLGLRRLCWNNFENNCCGKIENYSGIIGQNLITQSRVRTTHTRSMAANSTTTVSVEAAINELMDDNDDDGEYVLMSSKEDVDR